MGNRPVRSAVVIARALGTEGFTDHTANLVTTYYRRRQTTRILARMRRTRSAAVEVMSRLSDGDRLILGKFIGMHKKIAFDTGLRIGLTTIAVKNNVELGIDQL